ncbi:MAG TPA: MlaD family protein [Burkholderiales bacterium]|nr:MlaD family protein [Burkholderiales bacterium]
MDIESPVTQVPKHLQFRVALLLAVTLVIVIGFVAYVLYARGVFEAVQRLTLVADNAEGVSVRMDVTFSGFPIGVVRRIALGEDGKARIEVDVPQREAKWLRASSVFVLERGLVGGAKIRVFTGDLKAPPLPNDAVRPVLRGDTQEEIPQLVATSRAILENLERLTGSGGALNVTLANLQTLSERMSGRHGMLGAILGTDADAAKVVGAIERANGLLASLERASSRLDTLIANTDRRVLGDAGVLEQTQATIVQANALLADLRGSLKKLDGVLTEAQGVGANAKTATADLGQLRSEIDEAVRRMSGLIEEIHRKWPFRRETEITLP